MFCYLYRLRARGRLLPKSTRVEDAAGRFELAESYHDKLRRTILTARMLPYSGKGKDLVTPLLDAHVLHSRAGIWRIAGTEQVEEQGELVAYQQTWELQEMLGERIEEIQYALRSGEEVAGVAGFR